MSAERLYTPRMLAAAVELAKVPPLTLTDRQGNARSPACGSTLDLGLTLDEEGQIADLGMMVRACAVGQAAAAVFARHAKGKNAAEIETALADLSAWLERGGEQPDWPDLDLIAPARDYPGRHGAILLPWKAASEALSSANAAG